MERFYTTNENCFRADGNAFALGATTSPYTLYARVTNDSCEKCASDWKNAGGGIPDGWKAVSDEIPSGTQHYFYDNVRGTVYHLAGLAADEKVELIR